jgi:phenylacetate-CoA ligase
LIYAAFRRNIVEPLHALKNASPKLNYWKELEKTQFFSEDMLYEKQWQGLHSIINYVYLNNDFYRKRFDEGGVHPDDVKSPEDITKIPILTKDQIRRQPKDLISRGFSLDKLLKFKTGGATGKPLVLYITEECSEIRNACARRHDRWTGWEVGEPIGAVWGSPVLPRDTISKLKNWLLSPYIYLDTMEITEESVKRFAKDWKRVKPTLLFGHAHSLFLLAQYTKELSIRSIQPKRIISTSMTLMPHERKTIENVFEVKIFDRYGCEEVSLIASECEKHKGMHLNIEHLFVEFIRDDGSYVIPGEPGKIIVTDLVNKAMPFIRYQVEDIGVPTKNKCSCGRGLPLMENVSGRLADFLIKKDGAKVAGISLIENTLTKIKGINQLQIIQEAFETIRIKLVPGIEFSDETTNILINYFKTLFGPVTKVQIEIVDEIKPEASGKYRFSICKIYENSMSSH